MLKNIKRVLLKLSGEVLAGEEKKGFCEKELKRFVQEIEKLKDYEIAILVGGGNFHRGSFNTNVDKNISDSIGMIATVMNALMLSGMIKNSFVMSSFEIKGLVDIFDQNLAIKAIEEKKILILAGGSGLPFFSTDTAAAIRAGQIHADLLMKVTKVDGVYTKDPFFFQDAIKYDKINYDKLIIDDLKIMDKTSMILLKDLKINTCVLSIKSSIHDALNNRCPFTIITHDANFN